MPNSLVPGQSDMHTRRGAGAEALSESPETGRGRNAHRYFFRLPLGDFDSFRGWRSRTGSPVSEPEHSPLDEAHEQLQARSASDTDLTSRNTSANNSPSVDRASADTSSTTDRTTPDSEPPSTPASSQKTPSSTLDGTESPRRFRSSDPHPSASRERRRSKSHERHGNHRHSSKRTRNHQQHHHQHHQTHGVHNPLHLTYSRNGVSISDEHRVFSDPRLRVHPRVDAFKKSLKNYVNEMPPDLLPKFSGDVLVMGGYRGSILRSVRTHKQVWIPLKVGLNLRKIRVGLGLSDEAEEHACDSLYADGMLEHVGPVDISRPLIKGLEERNHGSCRIHSWGYDWRLALEISGRELLEHLKELYAAKPANTTEPRGTIIIAHSMGGLVAHHAVHLAIAEDCAEVIRGIVYVGTPFGCAQILSPLRYGDAVLFAKNVLTAQVNFSMRCSFYLLPLDGMCFANEEDATEEYVLDFFDADTWVKQNLSPCVSTDPAFRATQTGSDAGCHEYDHDEAYNYLKRELTRAKKFLESLEPQFEPEHYPAMSVVYSSSIPTARGVLTPSRDAIRHTNFDHLLYGAGDGVVHRRHIFPLCAGYDDFEIPVFDSDYTHVGLCCDLKAVGQGLASILEREGHSREELFKPSHSPSILSVVPMAGLRLGPRNRHSNHHHNNGYAGSEGAHSPEARSPVSSSLASSPAVSASPSREASRAGSPTPDAEVLSPAVSSSSHEGVVPVNRPKKSESMVSTVEHKVMESLNDGLNGLGRWIGRTKKTFF